MVTLSPPRKNSLSVPLSQLESHLWESANILRGTMDAADFKTYVFPLLFFKQISDVHDEEYQAALAESGGNEKYARLPQNYRFQIPNECHQLASQRSDMTMNFTESKSNTAESCRNSLPECRQCRFELLTINSRENGK